MVLPSYHQNESDIAGVRRKSGLTLPVLAFAGALDNLQSFHVLVGDSIIFTSGNVLEAVDIAFKLLFVADIRYPPASHQVWSLIQHLL